MDFIKSSLNSSLQLMSGATPFRDLSKAMDEFATDLFLQCVKDQPGNVIVSPLSVSSALALLSQAAEGNTYDQLKQGLHLRNEKSVVANQFLAHRSALEKNAGKATFSIANRIYVQQGHQLNKNFEEIAVSKFKSGIEAVNFVESAKSAAVINHFVEENTNGKIKEMFKPDQFDGDTRSVLVNAIYFKGNWEKPFNPRCTSKGGFYNHGTDKVSVDFMHDDDDFNAGYVKELDATALELKYANSSMAFVFILPNSKTGLTALETKLKDYDLTKINEKLRVQRYDVSIPKFKVEYEIELKDTLKNLGMTDIFTDGANLGGVLESGQRLKISDVVHKAFLEVDENGSEAGAAMGMKMILYCMPPSFTANHPFMFFIRDTVTNTIIFNGRIEKLEQQYD